MRALLYHVLFSLLFLGCLASKDRSVRLIKLSKLKKFVDDLPDMPRIKGYTVSDGVPISTTLSIGMYQKLWKFHRDLPRAPVFAYGITKATATVPGPTIEARQGVPTRVTWTNHLPKKHILPWDPTIPTAESSSNGIPTVVHLHGGIHGPTSDGNSHAWFTADFKSKGPLWSTKTYTYPNVQEPGNLWYHDHAMGLTRVNLLAGLIGSYTVRNPTVEDRLGLPSGDEYDRNLVVFDRSFRTDGSIYMNSTGNNPSIHPQWQPEYFGDAIIVNGKAWPSMRVRRRKYRFRIVNASNARFFRFRLSNGLRFVHVGSDSAYLGYPISTENFLLAPSEIADVVIDFAESETDVAVLRNDAPYPYPSGDPVNEVNGKVMRFVIERFSEADESRVPAKLMRYPKPAVHRAVKTRYIAMYEYESSTGEPTHLYLNGKSYDDPVTETPRAGTTEVWEIINLTDDNHPLHIHLGLLWVVEQRELVKVDEFKECMKKVNDAERCHVGEHARGRRHAVPRYERGWKNVFKMQPGFLTRVVVRFALLRPGFGYPFNVTGEPGYVYHCHILDHEDNVMMRPLKLVL